MNTKTVAEIKEDCRHSRGDVLEDDFSERLVVLERFINMDLSRLEFKVQWENTRGEVTLPEQTLECMRKVEEREEPYYWGDQ